MRNFDVIFKKSHPKVRKTLNKLQQKEYKYPFNPELSKNWSDKIKFSKKIISKLLSIPDSYKLVFTYSTSDSIDRLIRGFLSSDKIEKFLLTTWEHDAILSPANGLIGIYKLPIHLIPLELNDNKESILSKFYSIKKKKKGKIIAIISHITYNYGCILPIKELIKLLKDKFGDDVFVIIDGAHAFFQLDIDIKKLNPDAYVFDMYKWAWGEGGQGVCVFKKKFWNIVKDNFSTIFGDFSTSVFNQRAKNFYYKQNIISWSWNPNYLNWVANSEILKDYENNYKKVLMTDKKLAYLFLENLKGIQNLNLLLPYKYKSIVSIQSTNTNLFYKFLLKKGISAHLISQREFIKPYKIKYPSAVRFCFNSLYLQKKDIEELIKTLSNYNKRV